ncbi:MAG: hypothetical protein ACM3X9_14405 [Bacillota bacterium]
MNNNQISQNLQSMRTIVNNLRQSETNTANLARQLAGQEAANASDLSKGNVGSVMNMAQREAQAANLLNQLTAAEQNAVRQLNELDQAISNLQSLIG